MYEIAPLLDDPIHNLKTIRDVFRWSITEMESADLSYGHGSPDAWEESSFLICRALKLPFEHFEDFFDAALTHNELVRLVHLIDRRVHEKTPAAYLLKEAWLTEHRFYVDERALIPRELHRRTPRRRPLALGGGPGSRGLGSRPLHGLRMPRDPREGRLPERAGDGSDLSADALEVAKINCREYGLEEELELVQGDLFSGLAGRRFDVIISNPPYVTEASMKRLPQEYRHEPEMALGRGRRRHGRRARMLPEAAEHLTDNGIPHRRSGRRA